MVFEPIENKRAFELVADKITEAILSGVLKPDEKLPSERELSHQMRVGRSVVREAFRTLELSGLTYTKKGAEGGTFVKKPDATNLTRSFSYLIRLGDIDIDQLTEARLLIEKDVVRLVMKKNEKKENYKPADELIATAYSKLKSGQNYKEENLRFHSIIAELSDNPILIMNVQSLMSIISVFVDHLNPPMRHARKILESHESMLEEMKIGNLAQANEILEDHILFFSHEFKKASSSRGTTFREILKDF
jgi:DNA-binding FadR family transcriptional regulator